MHSFKTILKQEEADSFNIGYQNYQTVEQNKQTFSPTQSV